MLALFSFLFFLSDIEGLNDFSQHQGVC